ncbi:alpha/beta hydrolase [Kitasatospora sp. NPDC088548]|uniref:alpha/beta hydrolase n=1 Tax=Kitasatospora sp. NPDC088548 TaxID=3364075 RepID=UPI00382ECDEE
MPCAFRPYASAEPPVRGTDRGLSAILLARNLRDPATPYQGALRLREALGTRARMVVVGSGGHDAHVANGSACGAAVVTDFLVTGHRTAGDTRRPAGRPGPRTGPPSVPRVAVRPASPRPARGRAGRSPPEPNRPRWDGPWANGPLGAGPPRRACAERSERGESVADL